MKQVWQATVRLTDAPIDGEPLLERRFVEEALRGKNLEAGVSITVTNLKLIKIRKRKGKACHKQKQRP